MASKKVYMNVYADEKNKRWARVQAARLGISLSAFINQLIEEERQRKRVNTRAR